MHLTRENDYTLKIADFATQRNNNLLCSFANEKVKLEVYIPSMRILLQVLFKKESLFK